MKKIVLRAPVLTQSGYGVHSRQVARWLVNLAEENKIHLSIQCVPWGDTPWYLDTDAFDGLIGKIMKYTVGGNVSGDISFQVILPNEWDPSIAKFNVGITAGVETDMCNPKWINDINKMDHVVTPSEHAKSAFLKSGTPRTSITVIPESFPDALLADNSEKHYDFSTDFNFLIFGQITALNPKDDRKNLLSTIGMIDDVFKDNEDVGIVLKTNLGRTSLMDYKAVQGTVTNALQSLNAKIKVHLIHGNMSDENLLSLYKSPKVKCLMSLSRGEGFGLPILEAAAAGLPIISTKWSAPMEYMTGDSCLKVKYDLNEIEQSRIDENIFMKGARWAEYKEKSARECIEKMHKHYDIYLNRALEHQQKIRKSHSFSEIESLYDKQFRELLC
tara:strand:+ start:1564 stop:2724 length:1161 start_codon:yes stop_codon:yes gene_type:complete